MIKNNDKSISSVYNKTTCIGKIMKGVLKVWEVWKKLIVSGIPPLTLLKCKGEDLLDCKIYGNSVQGEIPSPDIPVEIESVGETILPSEYQQVEYVETQGQQYINTNYIPNNNTRIKVKFRTSSSIPTNASKSLFFTINDNYGFALCSSALVGKYRATYGPNNIYNASNMLETETDYIVDFNKEKFYLNDSLIHTFKVLNFKSQYALPLFGQRFDAGVTTNFAPSGTRLYSVEIWDNENPVRNLIPCYRKSDNVIGMYDLVNNTFYTNLGEGEFLKGKNKNLYKIPVKVSNDTEEIVTNIYLNEPLRKIGDYADYIDFENQKVVRNVEVIDNTGILILEESLKGLAIPIEETIELPNIPTHKGTTILSIDTTIQSSYMEAVYAGKGELELMEEEDNTILNSILAINTETQLNITNTEIVKNLDEIIGG